MKYGFASFVFCAHCSSDSKTKGRMRLTWERPVHDLKQGHDKFYFHLERPDSVVYVNDKLILKGAFV